MSVGIHIFRKDLRVHDNFALNDLASKVNQIIGVFILDPVQIKYSQANKSHYSFHSAQFVMDSLSDLNLQCEHKLLVLSGNPAIIIAELIKSVNPTAISFNADFTPYALKRDKAIIAECKRMNVDTIVDNDDQTLIEMNKELKQNGEPYMTYGPFVKQLLTKDIHKLKTTHINWSKSHSFKTTKLPTFVDHRTWIGGRAEALRRLNSTLFDRSNDHMSTKTSQLSAYLNLGCISIREIYWKLKLRNKTIDPIKTILWRDFLLCIYRFHPSANKYDTFVDERYGKLKWSHLSKNEWDQFENCKTGFLLIDAAMAELKETGFINNRARLLLATFWIKYLIVSPLDPKYGAQTGFSKLLIDCCSSQNKLNHLWVLGDLDFAGRRFCAKGAHPLTGRMIRIDNDMIKRYDPKYEYISKWIPEFAGKTLKEQKQLTKEINTMYDWKKRYSQYIALFKSIPKAKT